MRALTFAELAEMAGLSAQAYAHYELGHLNSRHLPGSWTYVSPEQLKMTFVRTLDDPNQAGENDGNQVWEYDGNEIEVDALGYFRTSVNLGNAAFVAVNNVTHEVAFIFRGTEGGFAGVDDWLTNNPLIAFDQVGTLVATFDAAIDATRDYYLSLKEDNSSYELLATGHSLGAALAAALVDRDRDFNTGIGIATPGVTISDPATNTFIDITHDTDPVGTLYSELSLFYPVFPDREDGRQLVLLDNTYGIDFLAAHSVANYLYELSNLAQSEAFRDVDPFAVNFISIANEEELRAAPGLSPFEPGMLSAIFGSPFTDILEGPGGFTYPHPLVADGWGGSDIIRGGAADDRLAGGAGDDWVFGGGGVDALFGGSQNDRLEGGRGDDKLFGGSGNDRYVVRLGDGHDTIDEALAGGLDTLAIHGGSIVPNQDHLQYSASTSDLTITCVDSAGNVVMSILIRNMASADSKVELLELFGPGGALIKVVDLVKVWNDLEGVGEIPTQYVFGTGAGEYLGASGWQVFEPTPYAVFGGDGDDQIHGAAIGDDLYGGEGNDHLEGWAGPDFIDGGPGDDAIYSGPNSRWDDSINILAGGPGNDSYQIHHLYDLIIELPGEGIDTVTVPSSNYFQGPSPFTNVKSYTLPPNVENADIASIDQTTIYGNELDNGITASRTSGITAYGLSGNDRFSTSRSSDITMVGGQGDDTYLVIDGIYSMLEQSGEGTDTVLFANPQGHFNLPANIENFGLIPFNDHRDYQATGNALPNMMFTGAGNDFLAGAGGDDVLDGGQGSDWLDGGSGADELGGGLDLDQFYFGDITDSSAFSRDRIVDFQSGIDKINLSSLNVLSIEWSQQLDPSGSHFQLVVVSTSDGAMEIRVDGTTLSSSDFLLANRITGGDSHEALAGTPGADVIDGGPGNDTMSGGLGNDIYVIDSAGDVVTELSGEGMDTVHTAIGDKNAPAYALYYIPENVENLVATSNAGQGVGGNSLNNVVRAGSGFDLIAMHQGGNDNVNAGAGADFIWFGNTLTGDDVVNGGLGRDTLALQGPFGALLLGANITNIERIELYSSGGPFTYTITLADSANSPHPNFFEVVGLALGANEHLIFDGSSDTDSRYFLRGGAGNDMLKAGSGNDRLVGNDGNDSLFGNAGNDQLTGGNGQDTYDTGTGTDTIIVANASQSTGTGHDILANFDPTVDRIDVSGTFAGWAAAQSGTLSTASFDTDLANAVNGALGNNQAVKFTATSGDQAGKTFVVYDANGDGSYTAGTDYVFQLVNTSSLESHAIFV